MLKNNTEAIVLRRTKYKDRDKIVSLLTRDFGRLSVIAKGVNSPKSRLAAGIEPFSVIDIGFISGRSKLSTLVSARVKKQYAGIVVDYERAKMGGEMLKILGEIVEDDIGPEYYELGQNLLISLDDLTVSRDIIEVWFRLRLLMLNGRQPELLMDSKDKKLDAEKSYSFDPEQGVFTESLHGNFTSEQIKSWRVLTLKNPVEVKNIKGLDNAVNVTVEPLRLFMANHNF